VGGLLLALGRLVRPTALVLATDMVVAVGVSGVGRGENVSLTLAPALLAAMIFLVAVGGPRRTGGPGRGSGVEARRPR